MITEDFMRIGIPPSVKTDNVLSIDGVCENFDITQYRCQTYRSVVSSL